MQTKDRSSHFRFILLWLFVTLFVVLLYAFLHEAGHAVTGLLFGQSLTEFSINFWDLSAHVNMVGGELSQTQLAFQAVSGASLPFLTWALFMVAVPRNTSFMVGAVKMLASIMVINTLLPWIVIPALYLYGKAPSDDVTHFLRYSQLPPMVVVVAALLLYSGGCVLFLKRISGLRNQVLLFREVDRQTMAFGIGKTIPVMTGIMAACVILTFVFNASAANSLLDRFSPPQDFVPVAKVNLSEKAYSSYTLTEFSLEESGYAGVFIIVRDANTTFLDVSVMGPEGYHSTVLHGEGYNADQDGGLWEDNLQPGMYQVVLTSHQSPGTVSIYLRLQ